MLRPEVHRARRDRLMATVRGPILLVANGERPRNQPINPFPFRQDSTFLYYTGCTSPGAAVLLLDGKTTLYIEPPADDDGLWHGHVTTIEETAAQLGMDAVRPLAKLEDDVAALHGVRTLAVPDRAQTALAARLSGTPLAYGTHNGDAELADAVIAQRKVLGPEELDELRATATVTGAAHRAAMAATHPDSTEAELAALFEAVCAAHGLGTAYGTILTVSGEVLHNPHHDQRCAAGQLLLLDGGAEARSGYATDVTRTWPVSGRFTGRQRAAYDAVLSSQQVAIDMLRPGLRYGDVHRAASRVLSEWLADEGLLKVSADDAVEAGAHAVFFPHGVGHMIGLDVHDLEHFGDHATYAGRPRSEQFGTRYLRIDLDLVEDMVVTIEPGFYVVPAILHDPTLTARFAPMVDFERAREWIGFGGIRIEDDVRVTPDHAEVLTGAAPKDPAEIESLVGTAPSPLAPFMVAADRG